jgi:hypothetical protein
MKLYGILLFAAMFALAPASMSQMRPGDTVVDVPFAFVIDGQTLPPGHYIVASTNNDRIRISNPKNFGVYLSTHAASRTDSDGSKLVFHRYGDTYFLSAVWVTGSTMGRELARSRAERELANHKTEMELAVVRPGKLATAK